MATKTKKISNGEAKARAVVAKFRKMTDAEFDQYLKLIERGPQNARERARLEGDREAFRWINRHASMEKYPHVSVDTSNEPLLEAPQRAPRFQKYKAKHAK